MYNNSNSIAQKHRNSNPNPNPPTAVLTMPDVFGLKSRRATHSGSWYTSNGPELRKQLSSWMEKAQVDMTQTSGNSYCNRIVTGVVLFLLSVGADPNLNPKL